MTTKQKAWMIAVSVDNNGCRESGTTVFPGATGEQAAQGVYNQVKRKYPNALIDVTLMQEVEPPLINTFPNFPRKQNPFGRYSGGM